jgi:hypothetical protein
LVNARVFLQFQRDSTTVNSSIVFSDGSGSFSLATPDAARLTDKMTLEVKRGQVTERFMFARGEAIKLGGQLGALTVSDDFITTEGMIEQVGFVRVEDAPASQGAASFNFICNEIYVGFRVQRAVGRRRVLRLPLPAIVHRKSLSLARLGEVLATVEGIGAPDYADGTMLQYLRSERAATPYQARGPKLVEMVRIYEVLSNAPAPEARD